MLTFPNAKINLGLNLSLIHIFIANISLKALQNDSINAAIKRLSIEEEHSGFELKKDVYKRQ